MKGYIKYIVLALFGIMLSCQKHESAVSDNSSGLKIGEEAVISFSTLMPNSVMTKAMGDNVYDDIQSMQLVVFDENGMFVESRPATVVDEGQSSENGYESTYSVTLTVTDQPRIIHFIANCPVEQVVYGHEASIIGNMYVEKGNNPQTAYWARIEVPFILVQETEEGGNTFKPSAEIMPKFTRVPMLRNFAQIIVKEDDDDFDLIGFSLYNTFDQGTVAPYNNTTQQFQSFLDDEGNNLKYPELMDLNYKGHALSAAELNMQLERDASSDDGYKWYNASNPFYMYERKISVKTNEEDKWKESPPHVIIKGRYKGEVYYYKIDLIYKIFGDEDNPEKATDIEYYNILRNFCYQFNIHDVNSKGYNTVLEAINGAASNNLSASTTTSKFSNISDNEGRFWVSYTDTTLVSNNQITLKYKYVPDIENPTVIDNDVVQLENITGEVIKSYSSAGDIVGGTWDGYREIIIDINDPQTITKEQTVLLKTPNADLSRQVRYYLKEKFVMEMVCPAKVPAVLGESVQVDLKLPIGLTEDMFPLELAIEVYDMTLSPDASKNSIPVVTGASMIAEKNGKKAFYFVKTIYSKAEYDALPTVGSQKILNTYWITNVQDNGSTIYVFNKYFNTVNATFTNGYLFSGLAVTPDTGNTDGKIFMGEGNAASISFSMDASDSNFSRRNITVRLNGLVNANGESVFTYTPNAKNVNISGLKSSTIDGNVSFTIEEDNYVSATSAEIGRYRGTFTNAKIEPATIVNGIGRAASITFTRDANDDTFTSRTFKVTLNGLEDADGNSVLDIKPDGNTVTVDNLKTTFSDRKVSFTVEEVGYAAMTVEAERKLGSFTDLSYSKDGKAVTTIGVDANIPVQFNFKISDFDGTDMPVSVKLVGLVPADDETRLTRPTAGSEIYVFYPDSDDNTLKLKTAAAGENTCSVELSSVGYSNAASTIEQTNIVTVEYRGNIVIEQSGVGPNQNGNYSASFKVNAGVNNEVRYDENDSNAKYEYNRWTRVGTLTINIKNITITGNDQTLSKDTVITINVEITRGNNTPSTVTITRTIEQLGLELSQ